MLGFHRKEQGPSMLEQANGVSHADVYMARERAKLDKAEQAEQIAKVVKSQIEGAQENNNGVNEAGVVLPDAAHFAHDVARDKQEQAIQASRTATEVAVPADQTLATFENPVNTTAETVDAAVEAAVAEQFPQSQQPIDQLPPQAG